MKTFYSIILLLAFPLIIFSQDYEEIKTSELPKGVRDYVTTNMPGGEISRAVKGTDQGQTVYGTVIDFRGNKRIMIFDNEGNFLRRAENFNAPSSDPPPPANTNTHSAGSGAIPMEKVQEKSLPDAIKKFLKENHTTYTILDAKIVPLGEAPMFQVILRDATTDNNYLFNAKGVLMKKKSYELSKSPFVNQYPLKK
ncbi:MAG: hypothetical protein IH596_00430 [Bacteroidales bacterium]|nr:hypothetical protein [Bacteroidales bacterium]